MDQSWTELGGDWTRNSGVTQILAGVLTEESPKVFFWLVVLAKFLGVYAHHGRFQAIHLTEWVGEEMGSCCLQHPKGTGKFDSSWVFLERNSLHISWLQPSSSLAQMAHHMAPVPLAKKQCACMLSRVQLFASLWIIALQAPLSMGFSRQEYWSGPLCPAPGHLTNPGIKPLSLMSPALAVSFFTTSTAWEVQKGMPIDKSSLSGNVNESWCEFSAVSPGVVFIVNPRTLGKYLSCWFWVFRCAPLT